MIKWEMGKSYQDGDEVLFEGEERTVERHWAAATLYFKGDKVRRGGHRIVCDKEHISSSSFIDDLSRGLWCVDTHGENNPQLTTGMLE